MRVIHDMNFDMIRQMAKDIPNLHSTETLQKVWPWEHDAIDPYRHYTGPRPKEE